MKLKRQSWLRRKFEYWLSRKFLVRYGPAMYQVRGEWRYVSPDGCIFRVVPTYDRYDPLVIMVMEE